jgi:GPH family glycoside/pentoside/hexuronide:cation symporter
VTVADRIPVRIAAFWGLGTFATTTMLNGVSVVIMFFLVTMVKVEPALAGALLFGSKIVDAVIDPPIGYLSDRTRTRWGRRRPYLFGASFVCGLSFALLYNVPEQTSQAGTLAYLTGCLVLYAVSYSAFYIPYMAMPAEMTNDYHERTGIMSYRVVAMTLGNTMGASGCPYLVAVLGKDRDAYSEMGIIVGVLIVVVMLLTFIGTHGARWVERRPESFSLLEQFRGLRQNRPLMILMGIKAALYSGIATVASANLFFLAGIMKRGPEVLALYGVVHTAATALATPGAVRVSRRFGKKSAYMACLLGHIAAVASWLLAGPDESTAVFCARAAVLGMFASGLYLYSNSMLIDTFAYDHQLTGRRREGMLAAAFSFVEQTALSTGPLVFGTLLTVMGFDKSLGPMAEQPESARFAIMFGFIGVPMVTYTTALLLLRLYRLEPHDIERLSTRARPLSVPAQ